MIRNLHINFFSYYIIIFLFEIYFTISVPVRKRPGLAFITFISIFALCDLVTLIGAYKNKYLCLLGFFHDACAEMSSSNYNQ